MMDERMKNIVVWGIVAFMIIVVLSVLYKMGRKENLNLYKNKYNVYHEADDVCSQFYGTDWKCSQMAGDMCQACKSKETDREISFENKY